MADQKDRIRQAVRLALVSVAETAPAPRAAHARRLLTRADDERRREAIGHVHRLRVAVRLPDASETKRAALRWWERELESLGGYQEPTLQHDGIAYLAPVGTA